MAKRKKFTLEIDTSNASFEGNPQGEITACLNDVLYYAEPDGSGTIRDSNGNAVGNWRWDHDE